MNGKPVIEIQDGFGEWKTITEEEFQNLHAASASVTVDIQTYERQRLAREAAAAEDRRLRRLADPYKLGLYDFD